jgi:hypothetical protein
MLLSLLALALGVTPAAHALPRTRPAEPPRIEVPPNTLPADPGVSPAALVEAARRLPATLVAMQHLAGAGYVRAPEADVARIADGHVCVTLGFIDPAHPARAPLVIVRSDAADSPTPAAVASAVFDVNLATGEVQLAPDVPLDAGCIVTTTDPYSTRPGNYVVNPADFHHAFMKWLQCAVLGCAAGGATCVVVGSVLGPLAPPAIGGCTIAACAVASYICIW